MLNNKYQHITPKPTVQLTSSIHAEVADIIRSMTDGDPHWDSKPTAWKEQAFNRIVLNIIGTIDDEITEQMDDWDESTRPDYLPIETQTKPPF